MSNRCDHGYRDDPGVECPTCNAPEIAEERDRLRAEVEDLRKTNARLNRRCQGAEAAARDTLEKARTAGWGLGRRLANWAADTASAELQRVTAVLADNDFEIDRLRGEAERADAELTRLRELEAAVLEVEDAMMIVPTDRQGTSIVGTSDPRWTGPYRRRSLAIAACRAAMKEGT